MKEMNEIKKWWKEPIRTAGGAIILFSIIGVLTYILCYPNNQTIANGGFLFFVILGVIAALGFFITAVNERLQEFNELSSAVRDAITVMTGSETELSRVSKNMPLVSLLQVNVRGCKGRIKELESFTREQIERVSGDYKDKVPRGLGLDEIITDYLNIRRELEFDGQKINPESPMALEVSVLIVQAKEFRESVFYISSKPDSMTLM